MSSSLEGGDETTSKKRKIADAAASYEPEPIQPEWLELPPELAKIDFSKMDFSEVAAEMMQKLAMPNISDVKGRIISLFKIDSINSNTIAFNKEHLQLQDAEQ